MDVSLAKQGLCCMNLETNLQAEDFQKASKVVGEYLPRLTRAVKASRSKPTEFKSMISWYFFLPVKDSS